MSDNEKVLMQCIKKLDEFNGKTLKIQENFQTELKLMNIQLEKIKTEQDKKSSAPLIISIASAVVSLTTMIIALTVLLQ